MERDVCMSDDSCLQGGGAEGSRRLPGGEEGEEKEGGECKPPLAKLKKTHASLPLISVLALRPAW